MLRPGALALLALLAAGPATGQRLDGTCMSDQSDQLRCELRLDLRDDGLAHAVIITVQASGPPGARAQTETHVGPCGRGGQSIGRISITPTGSSTLGSFTIDSRDRPLHMIAGTCVVTRIFDCAHGGGPTLCPRVVRPLSTKIEVR
jgi:hypothetical protein